MIKNIILSLGFLCLSFTAVFAQTTWGNANTRTETGSRIEAVETDSNFYSTK